MQPRCPPSSLGDHAALVDLADHVRVARQAVRMKKTEDAYATWTQEVRGRAYVEYRDPPQ